MRADDLPFFLAVDAIYDELFSPRSRKWTATSEGRRELARQVLGALDPDDGMIDRIVACFDNYGKNRPDHRRTLDVARRDGPSCFWRHRRPDIKCSDDLSTDHLIPEFHGGTDEPWNLALSCQAHNSARGAKSIDDFLRRH